MRAPVVRPFCQYFWRARKAMVRGMMVMRLAVMTRFWMAWPPAVLAWSFHWFSPMVRGYQVESLIMMRGRK